MNNFSHHELNDQFKRRCKEGERRLKHITHSLENSPDSDSFIVPDDTMAPDFHKGDIAWYRPGYGDGFHILKNSEGELFVRKVEVTLTGKIIVSTPSGVQKETHCDLAVDDLISLGRCYYAFRQIPVKDNRLSKQLQ